MTAPAVTALYARAGVTPTATAAAPIVEQDGPARYAPHERARVRAAAEAARRLYPGPVGEYLRRELNSWSEFGFRFADTAPMRLLVDDLLRPTPGPAGT